LGLTVLKKKLFKRTDERTSGTGIFGIQ